MLAHCLAFCCSSDAECAALPARIYTPTHKHKTTQTHKHKTTQTTQPTDVEEGGETAFPDSTHWAAPELASQQGAFSKCTEGGVAFKPRKGDALLFWSLKPDSKTEDPLSMHTGCPVLKGVKWTATKWIHARPFRREPRLPLPPLAPRLAPLAPRPSPLLLQCS